MVIIKKKNIFIIKTTVWFSESKFFNLFFEKKIVIKKFNRSDERTRKSSILKFVILEMILTAWPATKNEKDID